MATSVTSDFQVYDALSQSAYLERREDVIQVFNAASNGAIVLENQAIQGDFNKRAFYTVGGSMQHRDVNSTATVTAEKIGSEEMVDVKIPWKYGPYQSTEEAFKRRARSPEEFADVVGRDMADATLDGFLQHGYGGLLAAVGANTDMVVPADFDIDGKKVLTKGLRTLGDRFGRLALWVMNSATYFDLVDNAIDEKLFEEAGLVVYGGQPGTMGKPVLVTDTMAVDKILGLQPGAIRITESQAPGVRNYPVNDQENLGLGFRGEGAFNLALLGYSWDGDANPNLAALETAANWRKHFQSNKSTAGFIIDLSGE
ncbi:Ig domain-containing protein [Halomonas sp. MCCC 1A11036]|uniref:Ig domain-containing protein n=1 Tax=Billgrantia zhangzhouensis TaxID=2733481 RepID=A0ABS9AEK0_9GAMM|nr:major capsid protein [Halomonas zhangzhouensis]MCE8020175.1 Ig domain-containing protein [Halomonas zhangzhouensis]NIC38728.1 Ig domain-containing protein [Halomonas desiderata]